MFCKQVFLVLLLFVAQAAIAQVTVPWTGGDDGPAIQAALNGSSRIIYLEPGKTYITGQLLNVPSHKTFDGQGATLSPAPSLVLGTTPLLYTPSAMRHTAMNQHIAVTAGSNTFTYEKADAIAVGQIVLLKGPAYYTNHLGDVYAHGHLAQVISKSGSTITLSHPAKLSFTADTIKVYDATENICMRNLFIDLRGRKGGMGIGAQNSINGRIENCRVESDPNNGANIGIFISGCIGFTVTKSVVEGLDMFAPLSYGIAVDGHDDTVSYCRVDMMRTAITSASRSRMSTGIAILYDTIINNPPANARVGMGARIDFHANTSGVIEGNLVSFTNTPGKGLAAVQTRGTDITVRNNTINIIQQSAKPAYAFYVFERGYLDNTFEANNVRVSGTGTGEVVAVFAHPGAEKAFTNLNIIKNYFEGSIVVQKDISDGLQITDNYFKAHDAWPAGIRFDAIHSFASGAITRNTFVSNDALNTEYMIQAPDVDAANLTIAENRFYLQNPAAATSPIQLRASGISVRDNIVYSDAPVQPVRNLLGTNTLSGNKKQAYQAPPQ